MAPPTEKSPLKEPRHPGASSANKPAAPRQRTLGRKSIVGVIVDDATSVMIQQRREANVRFKESTRCTAQKLPYQDQAHNFYVDGRFWLLATAMIILSFLEEIAQTQFDPTRRGAMMLWAVSDRLFLAFFTFELAINAYAHWNRVGFWLAGWTIFDIVMVSAGLIDVLISVVNISQGVVSLHAEMELHLILRALRSVRVLRIFRFVRSLRTLMWTLVRAVQRCLANLALMLFTAMLFAIVGVIVFRGAPVTVGHTSRGNEYGDEYWGTWAKALYTLFQVWTFESWSEAIARPLIFQNNTFVSTTAVVFFPLYSLINTVFLLNVLASIFVDVVTSNSERERVREEQDRIAALEAEAVAEKMEKLDMDDRVALKSVMFVKKLKARAKARDVPTRLRLLEAKIDALANLLQPQQPQPPPQPQQQQSLDLQFSSLAARHSGDA